MRNPFRRLTFVVLLLSLTNLDVFTQTRSKPIIDEKNVRAEMQYLASDAMQGRGSGTQFEHITAEYVGSQFMQFGLEPAGEPGYDGRPSYVQTVNMTRNSFAGNPTLTYSSRTLEVGPDMVVLRATGSKITGELQKLNPGDKPKPNSAVFVTVPDAALPQNLIPELVAYTTRGASLVIVEENPQYRANWGNIAGRRISFTAGLGPANPSAIMMVSHNVAIAIRGLSNGTPILFGGILVPPQITQTWNAIGKLTGTDRALSSEVILLSSHLDHLGVRENAPGPDKIFNGADDDASGTIAVIEMARVLGSGKRPKRTVYFVCFGSEETGGFGANYFVNNLPFPKDKFVANLEFEMIGRPDAKVKPDELWLTGYDRSNLGPELARRGAKLVPDPHPEQNFFQRSDNYTLARQGIVAHTVSSFGLHKDYHQASDEISKIDFAHMTQSINSMISPVQWLINSNFRPAWNEGKKP